MMLVSARCVSEREVGRTGKNTEGCFRVCERMSFKYGWGQGHTRTLLGVWIGQLNMRTAGDACKWRVIDVGAIFHGHGSHSLEFC